MSLAVIIPNYNNGRFLKQCLNSVLHQTVLPDEIIVVDDCSTDSSKAIIKEYEARNPLVVGIYLSKNRGVSHARNVGLRSAKSEYVTTLDADDFYFNDRKLQNEIALIQEHGVAVAYSKLVYIDENNKILRYSQYPKKHYLQGRIFSKLLVGFRENTVPRDYCFPKSILEKAGWYDESSCLFEDLDLLIRIVRYLPVYCTFDYGTAYRIKSFGLSKRTPEEISKAKHKIYNKNLKEISISQRLRISFFHNLMKIRNILIKKLKHFIKR